MKFRIGLVLVLSMLLLVGCGSTDNGEAAAPETNTETVTTVEVVTLTEPIAEGPIALTSAGQSADVKMIESLIKKTDMEYSIDTVLQADNLGDAKTLILAIGGSSKGLGAAGINADEEIERINALIQAAKENDIVIIGMHVGGEGRRGELSDKFINASLGSSDYVVYVESGDYDGLLSDIAAENSIPVESVDSIAASFEALQKAFK